MKQLILMRHAKSSWNHPELDDHERPLNERGRAAAQNMGHWFVEEKYSPDYALVSDAVRTQETWSIVSGILERPVNVQFSHALYLASPLTMLESIQTAPSDANTVILIAHQPGTSILAQTLADGSETDEAKQAYQHYPTAAASVFQFEIDQWSQLTAGAGTFVRFATPKSIAQNG